MLRNVTLPCSVSQRSHQRYFGAHSVPCHSFCWIYSTSSAAAILCVAPSGMRRLSIILAPIWNSVILPIRCFWLWRADSSCYSLWPLSIFKLQFITFLEVCKYHLQFSQHACLSAFSIPVLAPSFLPHSKAQSPPTPDLSLPPATLPPPILYSPLDDLLPKQSLTYHQSPFCLFTPPPLAPVNSIESVPLALFARSKEASCQFATPDRKTRSRYHWTWRLPAAATRAPHTICAAPGRETARAAPYRPACRRRAGSAHPTRSTRWPVCPSTRCQTDAVSSSSSASSRPARSVSLLSAGRQSPNPEPL